MADTAGDQVTINLNELEKFKHYLGVFLNEAALIAFKPVGEEGDFAQLKSTDSMWIWDTDSNSYVNSNTTGAEASSNYRDYAVLAADPAAPAANVVRRFKRDDGNIYEMDENGDKLALSTQTQLRQATAKAPAYWFDGVNDNMTIPDNSRINFGDGNFSLFTFLEVPSAIDPYIRIIDKRDGTSGYTLNIDQNGYVNLELNPGTGSNTFTGDTDLRGKSGYLACVVDRDNNNANIYFNGLLIDVFDITAVSGSITSTTDMIIGADAPSGNSLFYYGSIGIIKFYNTALTASQIAALTLNPQNVPFELEGASNDELVTNGDFTTTPTEWVNYNTTPPWSYDAVNHKMDNDGTDPATLAQDIGATSGKLYKVVVDIDNGTTIGLQIGSGSGVPSYNVSTGENIFYLVAVSGNSSIHIKRISGAFGLNSISVKQVGEVAAFHPSGIGHNGWKGKYGLFATNNGATPFNLPANHEEDIIIEATQSVELGKAPAGYRIAAITFDNEDASAVEVKAQQEDGTYLVGDAGTYKSIPANTSICIGISEQTTASTDQAIDLIVNGTGKNIKVYVHLKKK